MFQLRCCKSERILSPLQPTPSEFADTLRNNIRIYKSSLDFTSFDASLSLNLANSRSGSYTFRIQGSPYHLIGSARGVFKKFYPISV